MACPSRPPGARTTRRTPRPDTSAGGHAAAGTAGTPRRRQGQRSAVTRLRGTDCAGAGRAEQAAREQAAREQAAPGETMAAAMQLAIALLTAGLDSPELEAWAADALTPIDADGLGDFMAGLHVISVLLLNELHEATGEPPAAILQRLAILAERGRGRLRRLGQCRLPGTAVAGI